MSRRFPRSTTRSARRKPLAALLAVLVLGAAGTAVAIAPAAPADPPAPTLAANPSANPTSSTSITFTFSSAGAASYSCKLDTGSAAACTSPKPYSGLAAGQHKFEVYAVDSKGKKSGTTSYSWTIDT